MIFGILVMITALSISAVAIYYSVSGLVAIFAAAAVPIMIMGSVLEIGKLVTAVWLHRYWNQSRWWLKTYLSIATVVLMFITSMGIFGFLSKAHIEQTSAAQEGVAQIERITTEITRLENIIAKAEQRIVEAETSVGNENNSIQEQIDREQERIDTAYIRIQPAIDEQNAIIETVVQNLDKRIQPLLTEIESIETILNNLSTALANNDVRTAQGIVGTTQDGSLGPNTSAKIESFRVAQETRRRDLITQVEQLRTSPQPEIEAARTEILRIRATADLQISQSNTLIQSLRDSITIGKDVSVEVVVAEQQQKILESNNTIDTLTEQKYKLETEYRKLEAEVGPIKYLAEFVYGETADQTLLEDAVKWVIIIIIFVFDPLAVLLLIASQATFEILKSNKTVQGKEEEITVDNTINNKNNVSEHKHATESDNSVDNETVRNETNDSESNALLHNNVGTSDNGGDISVYEKQQRLEYLETAENSEDLVKSKHQWKLDNPDESIKHHKDAYIKGKIDKLPWDGYSQNSEQTDNSIWSKIKRG